eukprot:1375963-Amorphochlora_amoeboformis.AAC.1
MLHTLLSPVKNQNSSLFTIDSSNIRVFRLASTRSEEDHTSPPSPAAEKGSEVSIENDLKASVAVDPGSCLGKINYISTSLGKINYFSTLRLLSGLFLRAGAKETSSGGWAVVVGEILDYWNFHTQQHPINDN